MGTFYVIDQVPEAEIHKDDPTEHLTQTPRGFFVASSTSFKKRELTVFDKFEPATEYFQRYVEPLKDDIVRLWKVSAWTQKGAAKKCMQMQGAVVRLATRDDIDQRRKERKIGEVLLYAAENMTPTELAAFHAEVEQAAGLRKATKS